MPSPALPDDQISDIVEKVTRALESELESITLPPPELRTPPSLAVSFRAIAGAENQAEALGALLAGAASFGARAGLFVVKDDAVRGWRGEGFGSRDDGHDLVEGGVLSRDDTAIALAIEGETVACGGDDPDAPRVPDFGQDAPLEARLEPIRVRDRVLGILYCDRPDDSEGWDPAAIELLARACELAVERLALQHVSSRPARARTTGSHGTTTPVPPRDEAPSRDEDVAATTTPPRPEPPPGDQQDPRHDGPREDARRFARLLMEELLLYNENDVNAGRAARDIESRLSERIEEARRMFDQRYEGTLDGHAAIFRQAMIDVLASGDEAALGSSSGARTGS